MNTYVEAFRDRLIASGKAQNTVNTYTTNAAMFVEWLESVTAAQFNGTITALDTDAYSRYLSDIKKQSLNTIKAKLNAVSKFAAYLSDTGTMSAIHVAQKKGTSEPDVEVLEKNELYKFLRYVAANANPMQIAIVVLLLNTGIRESELCNLELSDIVISDRKGHIVIRSGKGNKYREVPMNKDARAAMTAYLESRPDCDSQKVFIGQRGALNRNAVYKIVTKLGEKAIDKKVYPHMLRHQCFTTMAKNPNTDLKTIAAIAGHGSIELTARYYINSSKEEKQSAVEELVFF